jgi:replication factor A1
MDAFGAISHGVLRQIADTPPENLDSIGTPILQCCSIKAINGAPGAPQRFRVVFNDTNNFIQGMIATQANEIVTSGQLKRGSICRLNKFQASFIKEKHILVIIDIDVLQEYGEHEKLGMPVALDAAKAEGEEEQDVKPQPGNITGGNFYGNGSGTKQQPQSTNQSTNQRALPSRSNGPSNGGSHGNIHPIDSLSPYSHKWTIKARCTHKGEIKTWHNKNGEGKLFSVNFLDETGEIRATGFNDAVDTWYDVLQEGSVYYVSTPMKVQFAKKQFSNVNHDYELTFEKDTLVEKAEDMGGVPQVRYSFTTIADLQTVEKDSTIDCIGVLSEVGETSEIVSKTTQKPYSKRELTLVDNTGFNVRLTIWGKTAESFDARPESVVAFKGVKVSDFGGRSLSLLSSGSMSIEPDIEEAYKLKGWYDGSGRNEQFASHANSMPTVGAATGGGRDAIHTIAKVLEDNIGMGDTTEYYNIKASILYIKSESFAYPACQTQQPKPCNKKVIEVEEGNWRCEACDRSWPRPDYRYIMSISVCDHTSQIWLSGFNETALQIMGMSANDLMAMKEEGDEKGVTEAFQNATCQSFIFKCRAKMDTYGDQQR